VCWDYARFIKLYSSNFPEVHFRRTENSIWGLRALFWCDNGDDCCISLTWHVNFVWFRYKCTLQMHSFFCWLIRRLCNDTVLTVAVRYRTTRLNSWMVSTLGFGSGRSLFPGNIPEFFGRDWVKHDVVRLNLCWLLNISPEYLPLHRIMPITSVVTFPICLLTSAPPYTCVQLLE
jgi:hypothetical protein